MLAPPFLLKEKHLCFLSLVHLGLKCGNLTNRVRTSQDVNLYRRMSLRLEIITMFSWAALEPDDDTLMAVPLQTHHHGHPVVMEMIFLPETVEIRQQFVGSSLNLKNTRFI